MLISPEGLIGLAEPINCAGAVFLNWIACIVLGGSRSLTLVLERLCQHEAVPVRTTDQYA